MVTDGVKGGVVRAIAFSILVRNDCHRIVVIPLGQSCHISVKDQTGVKRAHQRTTTPENAIALDATRSGLSTTNCMVRLSTQSCVGAA